MRGREKNFNGCLRCRSRKVKCDRTRPRCENCRRIGKPCPGYGLVLIWVPPNTQTSKVQGRGGPNAGSTWLGWSILNLNGIDERLSTLDDPSHESHGDDSESVASLFSVLRVTDTKHQTTQQRFQPQKCICNWLSPFGSDWSVQERCLLQHYVKHVAPQMIPSRTYENPWTTHYVSLALQCNSLRSALLSQAAAHLWNLRSRPPEMEVCILGFHSKAVRQLRTMILRDHTKPFEEIVATILSLIMVDVYYGRTQVWRYHFCGAMQYAFAVLPETPWLKSEMAWLVAQSLCMLDLRTKIDGSMTSLVDNASRVSKDSHLTSPLLGSVAVRTDFGFTLGVSPALAECLSTCASLVAEWKRYPETPLLRSKFTFLILRLLNFTLHPTALIMPKQSTDKRLSLQILHDHIFALGLLIRLQRRISNPWPKTLRDHAISVLDGVERFMDYANNVADLQTGLVVPTIWPVFHAAVELYKEDDQRRAMDVWLNRIEAAAIGNREQMRSVLEKLWSIRYQAAKQRVSSLSAASIDLPAVDDVAGEIALDWMSVASSMGIDVLLV